MEIIDYDDIDNVDFPLPDQAKSSPIEITAEQLKEKIKDWMCIYPVYIDSQKAKSDGRKLGKEFCVESPDILSMMEAMKKLKISTVMEHKKHPKDQLRSGRLRIDYTGSKKEILKKIAELVPECKKIIEEKQKQNAPAKANAKPSSSSNNKKQNSKKKGKKRR